MYYEKVMGSRPNEAVRDRFLDCFHEDAETYLRTIKLAVMDLRSISEDYYGFDFSDEVDDMLMDVI
jgi:hypothetical protein